MSSFQIPEGPSQVAQGGTAVFSVNNTTEETMQGKLSVQVSGGADAAWFPIDGERERPFPAKLGETVQVKVTVPPATPPGDYRFRLRVAAVNDPDNDTAESPPVTVTVTAAPPPPPKKGFPIWAIILIVLAVLAAAGFGVWKLLDRPDKPEEPTAEASTPAPQGAQTWFSGTWTGTIDGRPATMRWRTTGSGAARKVIGDFSDGSSGNYVPLTYDSSTPDKLFFRHADGNSWFLAKVADGEATGWTTWQGRQFPLVMQRQSTTVN